MRLVRPQRAHCRNVISVRISERELLGLSVRIHVWLGFEPSDERACPLKRQVEIIYTEETGARCRVSRDRGSSMRDGRGRPHSWRQSKTVPSESRICPK